MKQRTDIRIRDAEGKRAKRGKAAERHSRERKREIRCIERENKRKSWIKSEFSSEREREILCGGTVRAGGRGRERAERREVSTATAAVWLSAQSDWLQLWI